MSLFQALSTSEAEKPNRYDEPVPPGTVGLCGAEGSPYTQKVLTALRYRRIPHRFILAASPEDAKKPEPPGPKLLPKILFGTAQGTQVLGDSTYILLDLERRFPAQRRSLYPLAHGMALLVALLEDFCDEWVTKAMYHYRWTYDAETAAYGISVSVIPTNPARAEQVGTIVRERQIGRLGIVGSNSATGAAIEESFLRVLRLLGAHLDAGFPFLFGTRPSAADFALFGQLHPMVTLDPNVSARVFAGSRRAWFWVHSMRDLSGLSVQDEDAGWFEQGPSPLPATLQALLAEVGRMYVPFMLANESAVNAGSKDVDVSLDGEVRWKQPSFKYQAKCVRWLREAYHALPEADRTWADGVFASTGCSGLFAGAPASRI